MRILYYVIWLIIGPVVATALASTVFQKMYKIIYIIEGLVVLLFTYIDILQNGPYGNLSMQISRYFRNITNNFYTMYVPFLVISIIGIKVYFKKKRASNSKL